MPEEAAFVPVIDPTLEAPDAKAGVPVKYPFGMLRVILPVPVSTTEVIGVNTRTGNTREPTPLEPRVIEVKVAAVTMAGAGSCWVPRSAEVANEKTTGFAVTAAAPRVKPDSVTVTAVEVPVGAPPIKRMIAVPVEAAFVPVINSTLDAPDAKAGVPVK